MSMVQIVISVADVDDASSAGVLMALRSLFLQVGRCVLISAMYPVSCVLIYYGLAYIPSPYLKYLSAL